MANEPDKYKSLFLKWWRGASEGEYQEALSHARAHPSSNDADGLAMAGGSGGEPSELQRDDEELQRDDEEESQSGLDDEESVRTRPCYHLATALLPP